MLSGSPSRGPAARPGPRRRSGSRPGARAAGEQCRHDGGQRGDQADDDEVDQALLKTHAGRPSCAGADRRKACVGAAESAIRTPHPLPSTPSPRLDLLLRSAACSAKSSWIRAGVAIGCRPRSLRRPQKLRRATCRLMSTQITGMDSSSSSYPAASRRVTGRGDPIDGDLGERQVDGFGPGGLRENQPHRTVPSTKKPVGWGRPTIRSNSSSRRSMTTTAIVGWFPAGKGPGSRHRRVANPVSGSWYRRP